MQIFYHILQNKYKVFMVLHLGYLVDFIFEYKQVYHLPKEHLLVSIIFA